jgi:hypothetical protein
VKTLWKCYALEPNALLVLREQSEVLVLLQRMPQEGETFLWGGRRWRVEESHYWREDFTGPFRLVEAVSNDAPVLLPECPGCGGIVRCADRCLVGMHREPVPSAPRPRAFQKKKTRSPLLSAPLQDVVYREGNTEKLACGHWVHYTFFKYVDKTARQRRCLECCFSCGDFERTQKRKRIREP